MALTDEQKKRYDEYFNSPAPQQAATGGAPASVQSNAQHAYNDAWNDYLIRHGMEPDTPMQQQAAPQDVGFFDQMTKGFKSGVSGVVGGIAGLAGKNAATDYFDEVEQNNRRAKDFDSVFSWDYVTDPSGLAYDVANQAGSMAALAPAAMLAPEGAVVGGGVKLLQFARKFGAPGRAIAKKIGASGAKELISGAFTAIPEALSEGGQTIKELDEQGDPDKYLKGAGVIAKNMALLPFTNALEWAAVTGGIKGAAGKAGENIVTRVAKAPYRAAGPAGLSALMNGVEEFEQTTFSNQAAGKDQSVLDLFQPSKWDDERRQALEVGALGSLVMAGVPGMARSARIEQQQQQNGKEELSDYQKAVAQVADETIQKNRAINEVMGNSDRFGNIRFNDADEEVVTEFERRGGRVVPNGVIYRDGKLYKGSDYGVNWYKNFEEMSADELETWKNDRLEDLADTANMPELQDNYFFSNEANAEYLQHIDNLIALKRQKEAKEGKKGTEKPATNGAVPPSTPPAAPPAAPPPKQVQDSPLGRSPQDPAMPQEYTDAMAAEEAQAAQGAGATEQDIHIETPTELTPEEIQEYKNGFAEVNEEVRDMIDAFKKRGPFSLADTPLGPREFNSLEDINKYAHDRKGKILEDIWRRKAEAAAAQAQGQQTPQGQPASAPEQQTVQGQPPAETPQAAVPATATTDTVAQQPQGHTQGEPQAVTPYVPPQAQAPQATPQNPVVQQPQGSAPQTTPAVQAPSGQGVGAASPQTGKPTVAAPQTQGPAVTNPAPQQAPQGQAPETANPAPQQAPAEPRSPHFEEGKRIAKKDGGVSKSSLKKQLKIGDDKANKLIRDLQEAGVIAKEMDKKTKKFPYIGKGEEESETAEVSKPETGQGGNQDVNSEPRQGQPQEGQNGEGAEGQNETQVAGEPKQPTAAEPAAEPAPQETPAATEPAEPTAKPEVEPAADEGPKQEYATEHFNADMFEHTKTKRMIPRASLKDKISDEQFKAINQIAKKYHGKWSGKQFANGFLFYVSKETPHPLESRAAFIKEAEEYLGGSNGGAATETTTAAPAPVETAPETAPKPAPAPKPAAPAAAPEVKPEPKAEPKTEPQAKPEPKAEPKPEAKPEPKEENGGFDDQAGQDELDALLGVEHAEPLNEAQNETGEADANDESIAANSAFSDISSTRISSLLDGIKNSGALAKIVSSKDVTTDNKTEAAPKFRGPLMTQLLEIGGYYVNNGKNKYSDFENQLISDLGEGVRPYIKAVWEMIKAFPTDRKFDPKVMVACMNYVGGKLQKGADFEDVRKEFIHRYGEQHTPLLKVARLGYNNFMGIETKNTIEGMPSGIVAGAEPEMYEPDPKEQNPIGAYNPWIVENPETGELLPAAKNPDGLARSAEEFRIIAGFARMYDGIYVEDERAIVFPAPTWRLAMRNRNEFLADANDYIGARLIEQEEEGADENGTDGEGVQGVAEGNPKGPVQPDGDTGGAGPALPGSGGEGEGVSTPSDGQPRNPSGPEGGTGEGDNVSGESGNTDVDTAAGGRNGESISIRNGLKVESMLDSDQSATPGNDFLVPADKFGSYQSGNVAKRAENNIKALRLLLQIEAENRMATPQEQQVLAQYTGWDEMKFFFYDDIMEDEIQDLMDKYEGLTEEDAYNLIEQQQELKNLLGYDKKQSRYSEQNDKYYRAASSVQENNVSVPYELAEKVWDMLGDLGFKGGRILAPKMHLGEFFASMPAEVRARSALNGIGLNNVDTRIAQQLYQKAYIQAGNFENVALPKGFFDASVYTIDSETVRSSYQTGREMAKLFDSTREDGIVVVLAPSRFMDSDIDSDEIKNGIKDKAKLLGAVRMPQGMKIGETGKKTAATQDLLIFQKHEVKGKESNGDYFSNGNAKEYLNDTKGSSPTNLSGWAQLNKFMAYSDTAVMVGNPTTKDMWSSWLQMTADEDSFEQVKSAIDKVKNRIKNQLDNGKKNVYEEPAYQGESNAPAASKTYLQSIGNRAGSFVVYDKDGKGEKVGYMDEGEFVPIPEKNQERAKAYVGLREETKKYLQAQLSANITDEELTKQREALKSLYTDFVEKHGNIHDKDNQKLFRADPDYPFVRGLESYDVDVLTGKVTASPSDILTRRTVDPLSEQKLPETAEEAAEQSLNRRGIVDIDWMAEVLGKTPKELVKEIEGTLVFRNPETQQYELADDYLSGNVGAKIELAEQAAKHVNPIYKKNVEALKKVQVKPIADPTSRDEYITARIGSTWVPAEEYVQFINSKFNEDQDVFNVHFVPQTGDWIVNWTKYGYDNYHSREQDIADGNYNQITYEVLGTKKHDAREIMLYALQQQTKFAFKKLDNEGKPTKEIDEEEVRLVKSKIEHLNDEFQKWVWQDDDRKAKLLDYYNRTFRDWTLRDWVGSGKNITLPGYDNSPNKILRSHQKDGVARIAFSPYNTYLAHCVGAGKTWTMQAAMMKMKELGLAKKGIFVEPNNVVLQFAEDFYKIFPNAKILVLDSGSVPAPKVMDVKVAEAIDAALESGDTELAKTLQEQFDAERKAVNKKRKAILERIANEDWDAVITSPEMFQRMNLSLAGSLEASEERLDELQRALASVPDNWFESNKDKKSFENKLIKEMRAIIKSELKSIEKADPTLKAEFHDKFWKMLPKNPLKPVGPKNQISAFAAKSVSRLRDEVADYLDRAAEIDKNSLVIPFEELGFDRLFVDEADMYKNLGFATKMGDIGGLNASSDSQRAQDMYKKMHYITRLNNGKGVIAASGTPVSNTLGEMFITNIQLDYDGSNQKDVAQFDLWAPTFAKHEPVVEKKPDGNGWRMAERFTSFVNAGEMLRMFRKYADVKMADELDLPKPKLKGGERIVIKVPMNDALDDYIHNEILNRSEAIKNGQPLSEKDNMLLITTDLRKASLDMRLVNPKLKGEKVNQKIVAAANQIYHDYVESNDTKGAQSVFLDLSVPKNKIEAAEEANGSDFDFLSEDEGTEDKNFSVYQELKDMLVAKGIPEEEIAFAQSAKNKDELQQMFEKVNQGQIRVIIGSTPKMGAGSNFQKRLYSQHHLDCPWKPRDMEQRDGRILRQGNMYDEVRVYTYVTEGSFDENMWGTVKRKATMINQAMSGELNQRTIEDVDAVALDYATIQAIASGNPLVAQYTVDSARLQKRQSQFNDYEASQRAAKKGLEQVKKDLDPILTKIKSIQSDLDAKQDLTGKNFKMTIEGKEYTDKQKAEEAFDKIVERFNGDNPYSPEVVGEISGFKIGLLTKWVYKADEKSGHNVAVKENTVYLIGNYRYEGGTNGFGSLTYLYQTGIKKRLDDAETLRKAKEAQKKTYEDELSRPFEFEAEYYDLLKKVDDEERQLGLGKYAEGANQDAQASEDPMQAIRDQLNQELQDAHAELNGESKIAEIHAQIFERHKVKDPMARREINDLIGEAQAAFPGAKDVRYTGNAIAFTMPNGRRIKVVLKDHVIVSGKEAESARTAHGLEAKGEALEVQGYSKRIGESSLIVLSEYSTFGTGFHEAFHSAWDLALTTKEKAALTKYYKDKTVGGEDVTETMANAYRDWLIKRREQRGTLFGKLWQKILDFVDGALNFLVSVKGTENVFRQIENGKIWNRQGRHSKGAIGKGSRNYMVGGEHAKTANQDILAEAKRMYMEGYTDQEIWEKTKSLGQGWWIGVDGHWRFEIPDKYSMIKSKELPGNEESKTYKEVYNNPALYEAYPDLANKKTIGLRLHEDHCGGTDENGNVILNVNYYGKHASQKDRFENYNTLFHEGQHSVQLIEGFAMGGNTKEVFDDIDKEITKLKAAAQAIHPAAAEYYRRRMEYDNAFYENDAKKIKESKEDLEIFNRRNPDMTKEQKKRVSTLIDRVVRLQAAKEKYKKIPFFGANIAYQKLAGEEEARWVEERAKLRYGYLKAYKDKGEDVLMKKVPRTQSRSAIVLFNNSQVEKSGNSQASLAKNAAPGTVRSINDIEAEVKKAFPGAKNFKREGQHITFTMPNGVSIAVDIENNLMVPAEDAERVRKEHGKDATEPIRANGYTETFDKKAAISLAQDSDRGTTFHESYHAAWNMVLNQKEKAAMLKHYRPIAKELGKSVDEVMADAYRDWQLARQQHKGTIFGKLHQKVMDFAKKALAILTGTENADNVMRKIAEGEVWNRDAQGRFTGGKTQYSLSSAIDTGLNKAESYVNRNVRKPNVKTSEGRAAAIFNNTYNKNDAQTWVAWLKNKKDKFYREWVDKNDALHQLDDFLEKAGGKKLAESEKIYNQVQVARALSNGAAQTLVNGNEQAFKAMRDRIGSNVDPKDASAVARVKQLKSGFKAISMQDVLRPIMSKEMDKKHPDYLAKHGLNTWRDAFSNYLGARRVLELLRIAKDKNITDYALPKGITEADLKAVVANAPAEFNQAAQRYYQLQRNMLILMEDGGLISKEVHDKINSLYKEYCPLMIDYSDTASIDSMLNNFARGADSIANVSSMLKYVLQEGSERGLISPLESTYAGINMLTDRAERNKVATHFVKMVEGNEDLQKSGILTKIEDKHGPDPKNCIFTVLVDGKKQAFQTTQDMYGPIVGFDTPAAGLAESLARNSAQILRAGATSSPSFIVRNFIRDTIFAGVSSRNGFIPIVDSFNGMWAYLHDKELRGEFDAMGITSFNFFGSGEAAVKSMDELMGDGKIHNFFDLVKAFFGKWQEASEIVEASTRMGEYMRARAAGKSMEEAALDARDVTLDFSRSGTSGRRMNMMVPFFNAAIQGGDKMYRLLAHKDPKVRMHTARMLGLYIMLPSLLLWAFNHDEPWYEELDPHIKMNNWILPGGIRIPKPQEAGVAFGSGLEAIMDKLSGKDPAAMKEWTKALKDVMLPNLIPTLILPLMEWQANYSYFREKAIEGKRLQRLPVEQRYNSGTSELSKAIGSATGTSPVKLDNTIRGYTGTMGMLFAQIPDMFFESKRNLPTKPLQEKAFVRDFFLNDMNMNRTSEDFYDLVSASQQYHAGYGKKGKPTPAVQAVNKALRDVSKQQKEIQEITNAKNISGDQKRALIDKKRAMIKQIQQATLKKYRDKFNV